MKRDLAQGARQLQVESAEQEGNLALSFDDFRNDEKMVVARRRIGDHGFRPGMVGHPVSPHRHAHRDHRRHRFDSGHVDRIEVLHKGENGVELGLQVRNLFVIDGDVRARCAIRRMVAWSTDMNSPLGR